MTVATSTSTSTSAKKMLGTDYFSIATGNERTLTERGRLQEITHEFDRYTWLVGLCKVRWKNLGEHPTEKGHIHYQSGELNRHTRGVGFHVNTNINNSVLGCCPVSNRLISIPSEQHHSTAPKIYAPTTG